MSLPVQIADQRVYRFSVIENDRRELAAQSLVDAAVDEGRLPAVPQGVDRPDQLFFRGHRVTYRLVAARFSDLRPVQQMPGGRLTAHRLMRAVVEDDMKKIGRGDFGDHRFDSAMPRATELA